MSHASRSNCSIASDISESWKDNRTLSTIAALASLIDSDLFPAGGFRSDRDRACLVIFLESRDSTSFNFEAISAAICSSFGASLSSLAAFIVATESYGLKTAEQ